MFNFNFMMSFLKQLQYAELDTIHCAIYLSDKNPLKLKLGIVPS